MPDGRFLSKSIAYSEQLTRVSLAAEVLFYRLIPHADIEGRLLGDPFKLKSIVAPMRSTLTVGAIHKALVELEREGLVVRYIVGDSQYLRLPGFRRHQKGLRTDREAASKLPPDPASPRSTPELLRSTPDLVGATRAEVEEEVEGEVNSQVTTKASSSSARARPVVHMAVDKPLAADWRRFLEAVPAPQTAAWAARLTAWERGDDWGAPPRPTTADISLGLSDYLLAGHTSFTPRHVRGFIAQAIQQRTMPPPANGHAAAGRTGMERTKARLARQLEEAESQEIR
jgi:hypothetical protein